MIRVMDRRPCRGTGEKEGTFPTSRYARTPFVPAGQSTQMIVGATPENDYQMMAVTQALYENYGLKRVFYSAYVPVNDDSCLPSRDSQTASAKGTQVIPRRTGCSGSMDLRLRSCCRRNSRISTYFWILSATGPCAIWSCFRWKSTGLPTGSFSEFPAWE